MPNWACTRIVAYGDQKQLHAFAHLLNTMPNLENGYGRYWMGKNGFGRYWMGNVAAAILQKSKEDIQKSSLDLIGTLNPNFNVFACFYGPEPNVNESQEFKVDPDGKMRFSTISARNRSEEFEDLILQKFPDIELAWSCTDQLENFHTTHNPEGFTDLDIIAFGVRHYSAADLTNLKADLKERCPGLEFPENADIDFFLSNEFLETYYKWATSFHTDEMHIPDFEIYKEV